MIEPTTVIVPINDKNRQGIDDILDNVKMLLDNEMVIIEAYVISSANPGTLAVAKALREKSGQIVKDPPKPARKYANKRPSVALEQTA